MAQWPAVDMLIKYHLPIGFAVAFLVGLAFPAPGKVLNDLGGSRACIALIFVISGLRLKTAELQTAFGAPVTVLSGLVSSLALTPAIAFALIRAPFSALELARGLALFVCGPSTLSSGVVLTAEAGGSSAVALLLTVLTNTVAVAVTPFTVTLAFASQASKPGETEVEQLDPVPLILALLLFVLLPLAVGKLLRGSAHMRHFVQRHSLQFKLSTSLLMVLVPWMKVSASAAAFRGVQLAVVAALIGLGFGAHLSFLALNLLISLALRFPTPHRKAVVLVCSQKTLGVAIAVVDALPPSAGDKGLLLLPCLIAHLAQILVDAWVAARWGRRTVAPVSADAHLPHSKTRPPNDSVEAAGDATPSDAATLEPKEQESQPQPQPQPRRWRPRPQP